MTLTLRVCVGQPTLFPPSPPRRAQEEEDDEEYIEDPREWNEDGSRGTYRLSEIRANMSRYEDDDEELYYDARTYDDNDEDEKEILLVQVGRACEVWGMGRCCVAV